MDPDQKKLDEIYRLTQENNRMLRGMRRHAFWGGILKFAIYAALLAAPFWFYMTYLNASVQRMLETVDRIQGKSAEAQAQISGFEAMWKDFQSKFPKFGEPATTTEQ